MTTLTITLPHPPDEVKPNGRAHFLTKSKATNAYRRAAWAITREAVKGQPPRWKRANVLVRAYFKTASFPDPDNLIASLKACFDGIADAGVIANDKDLWPLRPQFAKDAQNPRIELTITEEP